MTSRTKKHPIHIAITTTVANKAKDKRNIVYHDTRQSGLQLEVGATGIRTWFHRTKIGKSQPRYKLGTYPTLSVAKAQATALEHKEIVRNGGDPRQGQKTNTTGTDGIHSWTLKDLADAYLKEFRKQVAPQSKEPADKLSRLENHIYPVIGPDTKATSITYEQLLKVLAPLAQRRKSTSSFRKLKSDLRQMINFMTKLHPELRGQLLYIGETEFTEHFKDELKRAAKNAKNPYVPVIEVPDYFQFHYDAAVNVRVRGAVAKHAMLFKMLTGCRSAELVGRKEDPDKGVSAIPPATWQDVSFEHKVWILKGEVMKSGRHHVIPLSTAAIELLKLVRNQSEHTKPDDYLFYNPMTGKEGKYSDAALLTACKGPRAPKYPMARRDDKGNTVMQDRYPTPHGLRTSLNTFAIKAGYPAVVASMALSHAPNFKDEAQENYFDDLLIGERRALMDDWGRYCTTGELPKGWMESPDDMLIKSYLASRLEVIS